jgi:hypothetical protein
MAASTLLQLIETVVAFAVLLAGVVSGSAPLALLGGGFLMGLAVANILAREGGSTYRRAFIGFAVSGVFVLGGFILYHFAT